jgi:predicted phosphohydrolase
MTVWAISDLHLSLAQPERRERYAARWHDHAAKIEGNWRELVQARDLVLLPGDISMAQSHRSVQPDLAWLDRLPGTKVLSPGNHDRWWNSAEAIRPMLRRSQVALDGDAAGICGVIVCGARSVPVPSDDSTANELAAVAAAQSVLLEALESAARLRIDPRQPLYVLWHHPPFDAQGRPGPWVEHFERARVTACVYGHLHIQGQWGHAAGGQIGGVRYQCVAADAVGFRPLRIDASPAAFAAV